MNDTTYNAILNRVASGELVTDVAKDYGVDRSDVWRYSEDLGPDGLTTYTRARVSQAHSLAEDTIIEARKARGMDSDGVAAQRLIVDSLKWLTTKIAPRLYGDKLQVDASVDVSTLSRDEQMARLLALLAQASVPQSQAPQLLSSGDAEQGRGVDTETVAGGATDA